MSVDPEQDELDALLVPRSITLREGQWAEIQEVLFGYGMDEIAHALGQPDVGRRSRLKRMGERLQALAALLERPR